MNQRALQSSLDRACEALDKLREGVGWLQKIDHDDAHYGVHVDAVVKRFETLFEYSWKLLKAASEYQGVEAPGPRPAIQEAVRFGWIADPEFWAVVLDVRNGSVHDYYGMPMDDYLKLIAQFADEVAKVTARIAALVPTR